MHLTIGEQKMLLALLTKFEELFDGTLDDWDTPPVKLKLKPNTVPYPNRVYPVPFIHKETLIKEVPRLEKLGVLKLETDFNMHHQHS